VSHLQVAIREPAVLAPKSASLNEKAIAEDLSNSQLEKIADHIIKRWAFSARIGKPPRHNSPALSPNSGDANRTLRHQRSPDQHRAVRQQANSEICRRNNQNATNFRPWSRFK